MQYKLNLGRNCLKVIIRTYGIKEIFIPYYSCKTIWRAIREENCKIKFYHIDKNFMPACEFRPDDFILYINYFGLFNDNCEILEKKYKNLITDNTHAFYSPHFGIASFNSLRKFFPVQNGAYLYIKKYQSMNFEHDNLKLNTNEIPRGKILCHSEQSVESKDFAPLNDVCGGIIDYEQFRHNELILNNEHIKLISPDVENKMNTINFEQDKKQRIEIFNHYAKKFNKYNLIKIPRLNGNIPYCYPLCTNKKEILQMLSNQTVLRLWEDIPESFPEHEFVYNVAALPLIKGTKILRQ